MSEQIDNQAEQLSQGDSLKVRAKKTVANIGLLTAVGGGISAFALPFVASALHVPGEESKANAAHDDMVNAVLASTGTSLVDVSSMDSVWLQEFTDSDTFAVPTTQPDMRKARTFILAASNEIEGTLVNGDAASTLNELAEDPELTTDKIIDNVDLVDTDIANGDVYTPRGFMLELGLIAVTAGGIYVAGAASKESS